MSAPLLSVRDLVKVYPSGVRALNKVSLEVREGEFLVVIGLSGSGKTTLLRCLNGLTEPDEGAIDFNGRRREISMIFQTFNLVPRHSAMTNVLAGRLAVTPVWKSLLGWFTAEDRALAQKYLDLVGIGDKAGARADQLSGGQQQRVAIARALCQQPKLLLADEPVASLDPALSHTVMDYLRKANRELGITVVCNLHYLSLVREYGTRVVALRDGEIVFQGAPSDIDEAWFQRIYGEAAKDIHVR
jgi:phosphonate transport system ATP-binding protein